MKLLLCLLFSFLPFMIQSQPMIYYCHKTDDSIIIDGKLSENIWLIAPWTKTFSDITGNIKLEPKYGTRVKMVYNNDYLYIGAELSEPHIRATLTKRDDIIYNDNDFEIFIDPDGDGKLYYEIEINALNTIMDLLMTKPYFQGGKYLLSMNISGLKSKVYIDGTLNDPRDIDNKWVVEMAIPLKELSETLYKRRKPKSGDIWRINFSRVHWDTIIKNGKYYKLNKPEYNWVWSPTGVVDIHRPDKWGYLFFK